MDTLHIFQQYLDILTATRRLEPVTAAHFPEPVMVGAVGGSGSRLVVSVLEELGIMMAPYGNRGKDSVLWPPMERITDSMAARHNSREVLVSHAFRVLEELWLQYQKRQSLSAPVGLKIPASFLWLPELASFFPSLRYLFIVRNGLDMAFSSNQAQFSTYSWYFGINGRDLREPPAKRVPESRMLDYWLAANAYAIEQGRRHLGDRFHILDYDRLCLAPGEQIQALLEFLGADASRAERLASLVKPPESIGRHRNFPWQEVFSAAQLREYERVTKLASMEWQ